MKVINIVMLLINKGARVNETENGGLTPLGVLQNTKSLGQSTRNNISRIIKENGGR